MPNPKVEIPPSNDPELTAALGEFVIAYSGAESMLPYLLRTISGIPEETIRTLCSGMRTKDLISKLKGLLALSKIPEKYKSLYKKCLDHLSVIGDMRDHLVHRSGLEAHLQSTFITSDSATSKSIDPIFVLYNIEQLRNGRVDLIYMTLVFVNGVTSPILGTELTEFFPGEVYTWQYIPSLQEIRDHNDPDIPLYNEILPAPFLAL